MANAADAIALADELRELDINEEWIHEIVRKKILYELSIAAALSAGHFARAHEHLGLHRRQQRSGAEHRDRRADHPARRRGPGHRARHR